MCGGGDDGNASWKGWVIAISRCRLHDMPVVAAPNGFQGDWLAQEVGLQGWAASAGCTCYWDALLVSHASGCIFVCVLH